MKIIMPKDKPSDLLTLEFFTNLTHVKDLRSHIEFNLFRIVGKDTLTEVLKDEMRLLMVNFNISGS